VPKCNWQAGNRFELFAWNQLCMCKASPSMLRVFNIDQIAQPHSESSIVQLFLICNLGSVTVTSIKINFVWL
jgi:hypothetical protein